MKTLLLVEDGEDEIFFVKKAVAKTRIPCAVQVVRDGEQAIHYLSGQDPYSDRTIHPLPALVLLDLNLPGRNGLQILEWIRSQPYLLTLPVVMLTSSNQESDIDRAYRFGVNSYVVKSGVFDQFEQTLPLVLQYWFNINSAPNF
jgi:CheY-like chemotaxis protein